MSLPTAADGNRVTIDGVTANDAPGSDRKIGKVVAGLCAAGQHRINQARRGRGRNNRRDTVGSVAAVAEVGQFGCEPGTVAGLVDGLRGVDGTQRTYRGG